MHYKTRNLIIILVFVLSAILISTVAYASDTKISAKKAIKVTGGKITGTLSSDKSVAIYKGIPYAAPPVGKLRWKAPQAVNSWSGVKKCTRFSKNAMQYDMSISAPYSKEFLWDTSLGYSEDCLYLNVWTKAKSSSDKLPVIVYISGGGFRTGGSSIPIYDGTNVAKDGAVFVSINYRLGIFGFLALPELSKESGDKVSGNYAILDQIAALKWVQSNISKFGGDPDNVTVIGQSASSAGVGILMTSPKTKGLFKNAVTMSTDFGYLYMDSLSTKEAQGTTLFYGKTLKQLRAMSAKDIMNYPNVIDYDLWTCIDGVNILDVPLKIYQKGLANDVNLITGMATGDAFWDGLGYTKSMTKASYEAAVYNYFKTDSLQKEFLEAYPATNKNALDQYNALIRDSLMARQYYLAKVRSKYTSSSTYIYAFDYAMPGNGDFGAFHTSDVAYWLSNFSPVRKAYWEKRDYALGKTLTSYLVHFAATSNPNSKGLPEWKKFEGDFNYEYIGKKLKSMSVTDKKLKFWQNYLSGYYGV